MIVTFRDAAPAQVEIEGLLHCRRREKDVELILVGTEDAQIAAWADTVKAEQFQIVSINLEDQFIEYTAPQNRRRLFRWEEK